MREKYESLSLTTLKELAKARGLKGISVLRKPELIQRMLQEDEKEVAAPLRETGEAEIKGDRENDGRNTAGSASRQENGERQEGNQARYQQRVNRQNNYVQENRGGYEGGMSQETAQLDSGEKANGILEVLSDGYGFIRLPATFLYFQALRQDAHGDEDHIFPIHPL